MVSIRVLNPADLTGDLFAAWSAIQQANPETDSPYFRPEFTRAVAAVRDDVRVAVLEAGGEPVGFFPFQVGGFGVGKPVGGRLSDFHGLIAKADVAVTSRELLCGCGLRSWAFDHLPISQSAFEGQWIGTGPSHFLDLSRGYEAYVAERRAAKSNEVKDAPYKLRKLERDVGPVRVELDCRDRSVFDALLAWKSEQYKRTGLADVFAFGWTTRLLERIWEERSEAFAGWLSALWANDRLVAAHFAMRSFGTLHSWFPGYDAEFSKYSPGGVLLLEMARLGSAAGVTKFDLGKGEERYKVAFSSGCRTVAEGIAYRGDFSRRADASFRSLRTWLKTGPLGAPVRASAKVLRPMRERLSFQ